jgi:hypothetical protein
MTTPEMVTLCQQHSEKLDEIGKKLDGIDELLRGTDDKPGHTTRLVYVEKFVGACNRMAWIVAGTFLTALTMISVYWAIFRMKPPM